MKLPASRRPAGDPPYNLVAEPRRVLEGPCTSRTSVVKKVSYSRDGILEELLTGMGKKIRGTTSRDGKGRRGFVLRRGKVRGTVRKLCYGRAPTPNFTYTAFRPLRPASPHPTQTFCWRDVVSKNLMAVNMCHKAESHERCETAKKIG